MANGGNLRRHDEVCHSLFTQRILSDKLTAAGFFVDSNDILTLHNAGIVCRNGVGEMRSVKEKCP